ncbi:hypothetical protein BG261_00335 [Floricoccus tropicus]|uniref:Uncharacterized protein n=1 Tax=Floricoccus tropicus TaxID=1859473 RepID=A0A1E8GQ56_9LACT|nr:hypothetical protein [Floricoccus tropicus]OFI50369.1 hypothetical protein BG261_00335 [Floricoccus tropicus]
MKITIYLILALYGILLAYSLISLRKKYSLPNWLSFFNLLGSFFLLISWINKIFVPLGLIILLITGPINGYLMNGKVNLKHLMIKIILSAILLTWSFII